MKSDSEWRKELTREEFEVTRKKGTEPAFSGEYCDNHERGAYHCRCCGAELFSSDHKFDSGSGWPSFWKPAASGNVATEDDNSHFMRRTEVLCKQCTPIWATSSRTVRNRPVRATASIPPH